MKKNIGKRIISFALTLVLVMVSLLPNFVLEASALNTSQTLQKYTFTLLDVDVVSNLEFTDITDRINMFSIRKLDVTTGKFQGIVQIRGTSGFNNSWPAFAIEGKFSVKSCTEAFNEDIVVTSETATSTIDPYFYKYLPYNVKVTLRVTRSAMDHTGNATCGKEDTCTVCGNRYKGKHEYDTTKWVRDQEKDTHYHACTIPSCTSRSDEANCSYSAATCTEDGKCSVCQNVKQTALGHRYTYAVKENTTNVLVETCTNSCGHSATATLTVTDATYTGSAITTGASVTYSDGWAGSQEHGEITYSNNLNAGTATAKVTVEGKELTTTFEINEADISDAVVSLNPTSGTYTGTAYNPSVSVALDGFGTLAEGTDYTLSWDKSGFTNADTYTVTVTGKGNFEGTKTQLFKINAANLTDVKVEQVGTLTYTGEALTPTVSASATSVDGSEITFTYSTEREGSYSAEIPSFTNVSMVHAVYYKATADNHNTYYGVFLVEIAKATVTEPTIASKVYNGTVQTADIADTDLYTVVKNEGGTGVKENGCYDVVLELKDPANYKWSTTSNAQVTLQFAITRAENEWTVDPSITGWTYGETAKAPVGEAKFGEVSVEYSGTTNGGVAYNSVSAPTEAGSYTATFTVQEMEDYKGLEASVDFTIAKANYNMRGAKWNYTEPFLYDGKEHKVEVVGLPAGVTVESYENNTATTVGDYYAEVNLTYDAHNYNAPTIGKLGWTIYNEWTPTEYTATTPNGNGWLNSDFVITANDGYKVCLTNTANGDWKDNLTYSGETADGSVTFYLKNETDGTISLAKTVTYKLDKTAPTGKVEFVERTGWEEFVNTITFGLFYKDEVTVKATANDNLSGAEKIEYASSDKAMTLEEVKAITDWTEYTDSFGVTLEDAKKFVYFVRITDKAGNVTYLSTDGAEYDTTAPVLYGMEDGGVYHGDKIFKAIDDNFLKIEVDGVDITDTTEGDDEFKIVADNAEHKVVVTDNAGNVTEYKVTVNKNYTVTYKADGESISTETVGHGKDANLPSVPAKDGYVGKWDSDGKNITGDTTITAVYTVIPVVKPDEVKPEDKTDLEDTKKQLEEMLKDDSYTDDDKKDIQDAIDDIDDALKVIGNVEAVEELIDKLPENITGNDGDAIKAADDAYNALSDYEKSLVDEAAKKALTDAKAALAELNKPADPNSPATGDNSNMFLWIALLFISGGAVITLTVVDRKKRMASKR